MDLERICYEHQGPIATITLNRPEKLNALAGTMRTEILAALARASGDPEVRVVAFRGAGRAFCAGGDVSDMVEMKDRGAGPDEILALMEVGGEVVQAVRSLSVPVVALVDGVAAGAGAALACACDLRWASERARFVFSWGKIGLHPDWGASHTLPSIVGRSRALEWTWLGASIEPSDALSSGLVSRVWSTEDFEESSSALLGRLAVAAPEPVAHLKAGLYRGGGLQEALARERDAQAICWSHADSAEGIIAFGERRQPRFGKE